MFANKRPWEYWGREILGARFEESVLAGVCVCVCGFSLRNLYALQKEQDSISKGKLVWRHKLARFPSVLAAFYLFLRSVAGFLT